jgi:hypothetical protein
MGRALRQIADERAKELGKLVRQPMRALDEAEVGALKAYLGRTVKVEWMEGEGLRSKRMELCYVDNFGLCGYEGKSRRLSNQICFLGSSPITQIKLLGEGRGKVIYYLKEGARVGADNPVLAGGILRK